MKFDKILEVVKKRWVIISLCVVMLLAMIAVWTFVNGQQTALQKTLDERKAFYDNASRLISKQRHAPVVTPDPDAVAPDLKGFPNQLYVDAGVAAIAKVQQQSVRLRDKALEMNVHTMLVPQSLPGPGDPFRFQQIYLQQFQNVIPKGLQSATPPTEDEIRIRGEAETTRLTNEAPQNTATKEIFNKEVLQQNITARLAQLPEEMRLEAANKHKLYMGPGALSIQPELSGTTGIPPDMEKIWLAQMGLWVQQDVMSAIVKLNGASKKVEESPVKQVVQIFVAPDKESLYVLPATSAGAPAAGPAGAADTAASAIATNTDTESFPKDFAVSPTGRVCNGVFDVVQFTVSLQVQASDVERIIQEMERNRLLTVTQTEIVAVNSAALQQQGFYFGRKGIVTLTMKCEELFMRDWTHKLMPPAIKKFLNVEQTADQTSPPPAAL
jgi:hypothetical protein